MILGYDMCACAFHPFQFPFCALVIPHSQLEPLPQQTRACTQPLAITNTKFSTNHILKRLFFLYCMAHPKQLIMAKGATTCLFLHFWHLLLFIFSRVSYVPCIWSNLHCVYLKHDSSWLWHHAQGHKWFLEMLM